MSGCCGPSREIADAERPLVGSAHAEARGASPVVAAQRGRSVLIDAGPFLMGSEDRGYPEDGEGPVHEVGSAPTCSACRR